MNKLRPIQELIHEQKKYSDWLFINLAFALFIVFFLLFELSNTGYLVIWWAIPLALVGILYGYLTVRNQEESHNWHLLSQLIVWCYLKLTGRLSVDFSLKFLVLSSYSLNGFIGVNFILKYFVSFKRNVGNRITLIYLLLTTVFVCICSLIDIAWFAELKILTGITKFVFIFFLMFAFSSVVNLGTEIGEFLRKQKLKRLLQKNVDKLQTLMCFEDKELFEWVKATINCQRSKQNSALHNVFVEMGEEIKPEYFEAQECDENWFSPPFRDNIKLYKIYQGKVDEITREYGLGSSGEPYLIRVKSLEHFDKKSALSEQELRTTITSLGYDADNISIFDWQILLGHHFK